MQVKCWLIEQYVNIALTILLRPLGHAIWRCHAWQRCRAISYDIINTLVHAVRHIACEFAVLVNKQFVEVSFTTPE